MKTTRFLTVSAVLIMAIAPDAMAQTTKPVALGLIKKDLSEKFKAMDQALLEAAKTLSPLSLDGEKAHELLADLCVNVDYSFNCTTIGVDGKILADEPNRTFAGRDISKYDYFAALVKTKRPQVSKIISLFEGVSGFAIARPVFGREGEQRGAVSILISGREMLETVVIPRTEGLPVAITIMQKDGWIIYDTDPIQIGKNIFTDTYYERFGDLKKLARVVADRVDGTGTYRFLKPNTDDVVNKEAFWDTFGVYGTEWRVVLIKDLKEVKQVAAADAGWIAGAKLALAKTASTAELKKALSLHDEEAALAIFKRFVEKYPGVYSVQWVDSHGFNRFGYPAQNSLTDYDYNSSGLARDKQFLDALGKKGAAEFSGPLWEGKTGRFFTQSVSDKDINLGYIYFMIRE